MNCQRIQERLHAFLDEELDIGLRQRITAHLRDCAACQLELAELRAFDEFLSTAYPSQSAALGAFVPPDFAAHIVASAQAESVPVAALTKTQQGVAREATRRRWLPFLGWLKPAVTMAVILLAVICGHYAGHNVAPLLSRHNTLPAPALPTQAIPRPLLELIPQQLVAFNLVPENKAEQGGKAQQ